MEAASVAEIVVSRSEVWPLLYGLTEALDRLGDAAQLDQQRAEIVGGFGIVRLQAQGDFAAGQGTLGFAGGAVGFRQVGVVGGDARRHGDGAFD